MKTWKRNNELTLVRTHLQLERAEARRRRHRGWNELHGVALTCGDTAQVASVSAPSCLTPAAPLKAFPCPRL